MTIFLILSITVFGFVVADKIAAFFVLLRSFNFELSFENKFCFQMIFMVILKSILFLIIRLMCFFCCYKIITTAIAEFFKYFKVL